jgi:SpoVK/Ycf46/Vps4 family AAA+-type ATPase
MEFASLWNALLPPYMLTNLHPSTRWNALSTAILAGRGTDISEGELKHALLTFAHIQGVALVVVNARLLLEYPHSNRLPSGELFSRPFGYMREAVCSNTDMESILQLTPCVLYIENLSEVTAELEALTKSGAAISGGQAKGEKAEDAFAKTLKLFMQDLHDACRARAFQAVNATKGTTDSFDASMLQVVSSSPLLSRLPASVRGVFHKELSMRSVDAIDCARAAVSLALRRVLSTDKDLSADTKDDLWRKVAGELISIALQPAGVASVSMRPPLSPSSMSASFTNNDSAAEAALALSMNTYIDAEDQIHWYAVDSLKGPHSDTIDMSCLVSTDEPSLTALLKALTCDDVSLESILQDIGGSRGLADSDIDADRAKVHTWRRKHAEVISKIVSNAMMRHHGKQWVQLVETHDDSASVWLRPGRQSNLGRRSSRKDSIMSDSLAILESTSAMARDRIDWQLQVTSKMMGTLVSIKAVDVKRALAQMVSFSGGGGGGGRGGGGGGEGGSNASAVSDTKVSPVHWADIGGLDNVREEILNIVQLPYERPELFPPGVPRRRGVLLYGPPGTGKTLVARAVATECGMAFISVKGPELLDLYVGESERNVRRVFQAARESSPCVLFFDELDSLAPARGKGSGSGGVMDRVVSQLLTEMDNLSSSQKDSNASVPAGSSAVGREDDKCMLSELIRKQESIAYERMVQGADGGPPPILVNEADFSFFSESDADISRDFDITHTSLAPLHQTSPLRMKTTKKTGRGGAAKAMAGEVFVIAATNRPDLLDPGLMRPGRFDRKIFLSVCKDPLAREQILKAQTRKFHLSDDVDLLAVARAMPTMVTGADISSLTSSAYFGALQRTINALEEEARESLAGSSSSSSSPSSEPAGSDEVSAWAIANYMDSLPAERVAITVSQADFITAALSLRPSVSEKELRHYEQIGKVYNDAKAMESFETKTRDSPATELFNEFHSMI